jgi:hypothetical protein
MDLATVCSHHNQVTRFTVSISAEMSSPWLRIRGCGANHNPHYSGTLNESHFPRSFPWKDPWIRKKQGTTRGMRNEGTRQSSAQGLTRDVGLAYIKRNTLWSIQKPLDYEHATEQRMSLRGSSPPAYLSRSSINRKDHLNASQERSDHHCLRPCASHLP